tara:strand:+ start:113 stop:856 length:744 start_codon:yes stop_codon:yes gene_type:complete
MSLVSIILPTFNSAQFISQTINSIISQTYSNWELIITDDCSSDDTTSIIETFRVKDARIELFKLKSNSGSGNARNNSIKHAKGRYIAFCDSDDQWMPHKLKKQISFMRDKDVAFTYTSYDVINEDGDFQKTIDCPKTITYNELLRNNYIGCLTVMYDAAKLGKMYMSEIRKRQDWVLWFEILKKTQIGYGIEESLALYRLRSNAISAKKLKLIKYNWRIYRIELKYSWLCSLLLIINFMLYYIKKKI